MENFQPTTCYIFSNNYVIFFGITTGLTDAPPSGLAGLLFSKLAGTPWRVSGQAFKQASGHIIEWTTRKWQKLKTKQPKLADGMPIFHDHTPQKPRKSKTTVSQIQKKKKKKKKTPPA